MGLNFSAFVARRYDRYVIFTSFVLCSLIFTSLAGWDLSRETTAIIHLVSYLILGLLFEIPEMTLGVCCWVWSARDDTIKRKISVINRVARVRYFLTHLVAPCAGMFSVASGLRLIDQGGRSLTEGWLFWIIVLSTIGLYKGINHHNPFARRLLTLSSELDPHDPDSWRAWRRLIRSPFDQALIFSELPTYAINLWLGYSKATILQPLSGVFGFWESQWPGSIVGLGVVASGALLIWPLRGLMKKYSRVG